jgi:hypothetical protein
MAQILQERRRLVLLILVVVVLLCLVVALALNLLLGGGDDVAGGDTPTPTATPTEEGPIVIVTPEEEITPTPTRVVGETPTAEPTAEPTEEATPAPTIAPTVVVTSTGADFTLSPSDTTSAGVSLEPSERFVNGGFDAEFDDSGVGTGWQYFKTDGAIVSFSSEEYAPLIKEGSSAQRISVQEAFEPNHYAGIYQTVKVVPNQLYTLTINGQVRTYYGDVEQSGYGYRVQYAVDLDGGQDWRKIPENAWVELPWGEEKYGSDAPEFSEYSTVVTPTSDEMTIFIRAWNKWADPKLVEYTFDSLSLVGPDPAKVVVQVVTEEQMVDGALPVTGAGNLADFITDGRFWGALLVLVLLAIGATYRAKWTW